MTSVRTVSLRWQWLVAALLMLAELLVFNRMTEKHHTPFYPRWTDQIQYLTDAYTAYDEMQAHGLVAGLKLTAVRPTAQGTLHDTSALLVFWVLGSASRGAALSINMLVFLAWQAALLYTVTRLTGSRALGWAAFGLVLGLAGPWAADAGSAVDFRLDHAAVCLFGITACVALLTDDFRSRGWSLAFGAMTGVTLLERFLTGAYFAPLFVLTAMWLLRYPDRWLRIRHLVMAGLVTTVMALPFFWLQRSIIYGYYWSGHITGNEAAARVRATEFWPSIRFVFEHLTHIHLGAWLGWMVLAVLAGLAILFLLGPRKRAGGLAPSWLFFSCAWWLVPALILTLHRQKSEYVLGVIAPGLVLLVLWLCWMLWSRIDFDSGRPGRRWLPAAPALAMLVAGGCFFVRQQARLPYGPTFAESAGRINELADYIFATSRAANLANPDIGFDRIEDYFDGRIMRVVCYERQGVWMNFQLHLPDSILAGPDETVFFKLAHCDFVLFTEPGGADYGSWPYDQQMRRLSPAVKAWCNEHLVLARTLHAFNRDMALYQRPELP